MHLSSFGKAYIGDLLLNTGKGLLKKYLKCKEQDMSLKALLQELTNEQAGTNDEVHAQPLRCFSMPYR